MLLSAGIAGMYHNAQLGADFMRKVRFIRKEVLQK
jgi:hypothetical protein